MPAQLFLGAGIEPGDVSCGSQGGTDREQERERERDIHESCSLLGSWRLLLVLFTAAHHLCSPGGCTHLQSSDVKDSKLRE